MELPLVCDLSELATGGDSDDLIVQWVILVHEMLEDLIDNGLFLFCNFDGDPLRDDDGDTAANDIVARLLLASFRNQRVL
jgi:hypothetical protein